MYPSSRQPLHPVQTPASSLLADTTGAALDSLRQGLAEARQAITAPTGGTGSTARIQSENQRRIASAFEAAEQLLEIAGKARPQRA